MVINVSDHKRAADNSNDSYLLLSTYCVPGSSPTFIQQIRTMGLVGAGYSAGSWGPSVSRAVTSTWSRPPSGGQMTKMS